MACTVFHARLHDTVTETSFGPQCRDDNEGAALLYHVWRTRGLDPRIVDFDELELALRELRTGADAGMTTHVNVRCACGSGLPTQGRMWTRHVEHTRCTSCDTWTPVPQANAAGGVA
jgi:hypothetical protein